MLPYRPSPEHVSRVFMMHGTWYQQVARLVALPGGNFLARKKSITGCAVVEGGWVFSYGRVLSRVLYGVQCLHRIIGCVVVQGGGCSFMVVHKYHRMCCCGGGGGVFLW